MLEVGGCAKICGVLALCFVEPVCVVSEDTVPAVCEVKNSLCNVLSFSVGIHLTSLQEVTFCEDVLRMVVLVEQKL